MADDKKDKKDSKPDKDPTPAAGTRGVDPKKMVPPDISAAVEGQAGTKVVGWVILAIGCVIGAIMVASWVAGVIKEMRTGVSSRPRVSLVNPMTQPPARKEIVAPVGEWSPAENVAGVYKFTLAYGGPVEVRLKRFDGKFEIKKRDPKGPSVDLGRFETIAFRSLGSKPVTNWIVFPNQ